MKTSNVLALSLLASAFALGACADADTQSPAPESVDAPGLELAGPGSWPTCVVAEENLVCPCPHNALPSAKCESPLRGTCCQYGAAEY